MERYESYKDSGVQWLGEIPSHWEIGKVKYYYKMQTGFTPQTGKSDYYSDNDVNTWVTIGDIKGKYVSQSSSHISNLYIKNYKPQIVPKGSLLYSFKLSVGQVAFATKDLYTNEAIVSFLDNENVCLGYMFYSAPVFIIKNANTNIYGANILNQNLIKNAIIAFPPLDEQQAIAKYLDSETLKIDEAIAQQQKMIDLLNERKQIIINTAVTKGLNPDAEMKESGIEWIGHIPSHWSIIKVRNLIQKNRDGIKIGPFGSSLTGKVEMDLPFKVYGQWNISSDDFSAGKNYVSKETYNTLFSYKVNSGDVLISMMGTIGKCAIVPEDIVPGIMDSHVIKVRLNNDVISNRFFRYAYDKDFCKCTFDAIQVLKKGSIMDGLNSSIVKDIPLAVPPTIEEQNQISDYIELISTPINNAINSCTRLINLLREKKNILINDVVTGKIKI